MEAVVFDMDGVIFDSEQLVLDSWETVAGKYEISDIKPVMLRCVGTNRDKTKEIVLDAYGKDFPYEKFRAEASAQYQRFMDQGKLTLKPGLHDLLDYLKDRRIPMAVASSTRREMVKKELTYAGVIDSFQVIYGGDNVRNSKPHPEIYLETCKSLGVAPEESYAIEDSIFGIEAAYRAGMTPLMVPDLLEPTPEAKKQAKGIFQDLREVRDYLIQVEKDWNE